MNYKLLKYFSSFLHGTIIDTEKSFSYVNFFIGFNIKILAKQKCLIKCNFAITLFNNWLNNGILKGK